MPLTREQALERARAWRQRPCPHAAAICACDETHLRGDCSDCTANLVLAIQRETARECREIVRNAAPTVDLYSLRRVLGGTIEHDYPAAFTEDPTDDA